jgi:hypothetical protein
MKGRAIYLDAMTAIKKGHPAKNAPKYRCKTNVFSVGNAPLRQKRGCTMNNSNPNDCDFQSHEPGEDENQALHLQVVKKGQPPSLYVSGRFLELTGDFIQAGLLSYFVKWVPYSGDPDGWIYVSYISKYPKTQTICDDLKITCGQARKGVAGLEEAQYITTDARWVPSTRVKRLYVLVNQDDPVIAAELAEHKKRCEKRKRRKSYSDSTQSKSDFGRSEADRPKSSSDFDLYSNKTSPAPPIEAGEGVSDSDIKLVHQWLRTINSERTRSDAIAYINKRVINGQPTPDLTTRLDELRSKAKTKQRCPSADNDQAISGRRALYNQIMGGGV